MSDDTPTLLTVDEAAQALRQSRPHDLSEGRQRRVARLPPRQARAAANSRQRAPAAPSSPCRRTSVTRAAPAWSRGGPPTLRPLLAIGYRSSGSRGAGAGSERGQRRSAMTRRADDRLVTIAQAGRTFGLRHGEALELARSFNVRVVPSDQRPSAVSEPRVRVDEFERAVRAGMSTRGATSVGVTCCCALLRRIGGRVGVRLRGGTQCSLDRDGDCSCLGEVVRPSRTGALVELGPLDGFRCRLGCSAQRLHDVVSAHRAHSIARSYARKWGPDSRSRSFIAPV
jgi:hypothetical protein